MTRRTPACVLLALALAAPACRRAHEASPQARMYLERAEDYARRSSVPEAIAEADKAVRIDPDVAEAQLVLGRLLRQFGAATGAGRDDRLGHYRRARAALGQAVTLDPRAAAPRIELAQLLADAQQTRQAIEVLEPVARPGAPEARFHLASILAGAGDQVRAQELYAAGLAERPDDAQAHRAYGLTLGALGDFASARREHEAAVRLDPTSSLSYYHLGVTLGKLAETELSLVALDRAATLDPGSEDALYALAQAFRRAGRTDPAAAAEKEFERLRAGRAAALVLEDRLAARPDDAEARLQLAASYLERGQLLRAAGAAKVVLGATPGTAEYRGGGDAPQASGEGPRGPAAERRLQAEAHRVIAEVHRRSGAPALALVEAEAAMALAPDDAEIVDTRARAELDAARGEEAERDFVRAYELGRRTGPLLENLSSVALAAGRPRRALRFVAEGLGLEPFHPQLYKVMARTLLALGDRNQAARILLTYLVWRPADAEAMTLLLGLARAAGDAAAVRQMQPRLDLVVPPQARHS